MRAVVEQIKKPYDTNDWGTTLYIYFDVLECGHLVRVFRRPPPKMREAGHDVRDAQAKIRRCKKCEEQQ